MDPGSGTPLPDRIRHQDKRTEGTRGRLGVNDGSPSPGRGRGCEWKAGWSPNHCGPGPHALLPTGAKAWPMAFELLCPSVPWPGREFAARVLCSTTGAHARAPTACPTSPRLQALWVPQQGGDSCDHQKQKGQRRAPVSSWGCQHPRGWVMSPG